MLVQLTANLNTKYEGKEAKFFLYLIKHHIINQVTLRFKKLFKQTVSVLTVSRRKQTAATLQ